MKKIILYRACNISDLCSGVWGLFDYGLANHRGTNVDATFRDDGYTTHGLATTDDPAVAFCYACMQASRGNEVGIFAILVDEAEARRGSILRQAQASDIHSDQSKATCWKSVTAMREYVLSHVKRSSVLGYYTVNNYNIGEWKEISGDSQIKLAACKAITHKVSKFRDDNGGVVTSEVCVHEISRLMGGA